uniref:Uncharacterized protein n=1 Tax=Oryza barthii TaxID=65489 RepID=A0A0D3FKC0_9ORYZ
MAAGVGGGGAGDPAGGSQAPHRSVSRPPSTAGTRSPPVPFLPSLDPVEGRGVGGSAAGGERGGWRWAV